MRLVSIIRSSPENSNIKNKNYPPFPYGNFPMTIGIVWKEKTGQYVGQKMDGLLKENLACFLKIAQEKGKLKKFFLTDKSKTQ